MLAPSSHAVPLPRKPLFVALFHPFTIHNPIPATYNKTQFAKKVIAFRRAPDMRRKSTHATGTNTHERQWNVFECVAKQDHNATTTATT